MTTGEFILKLSEEGRAWIALILPAHPAMLAAVLSGVVGWHFPQPPWLKKKAP